MPRIEIQELINRIDDERVRSLLEGIRDIAAEYDHQAMFVIETVDQIMESAALEIAATTFEITDEGIDQGPVPELGIILAALNPQDILPALIDIAQASAEAAEEEINFVERFNGYHDDVPNEDTNLIIT